MRKLLFIFIVGILTNNLIAQNKEYILLDNQDNTSCYAFKVKSEQISTIKYLYKETDNPEYLEKKAKQDSIESVIENQNDMLLNSVTKQFLSKAQNHLELAIKQSNKQLSTKSISSFASDLAKSTGKWKDIKIAKENLDKTEFEFEQNTKGKYKIAIKQANVNLERIYQIQNKDNSLKRLITVNRIELKSLKTKYIKETKLDYVPTITITRDILIVEPDSVFLHANNNILIPWDSISYDILLNDFLHFKKGELIPKDTIQRYRMYRDVNQYPKYVRIDKYDYLYNSKEKYLFYNKSTNQLYYTNSNILGNCALEKDLYDLSMFLRESGGNIYYDNDQLIVEHKGNKCLLTPIVKKELVKKNISIIQKMSSSVKLHVLYKNQASELADEMAKYLSAYRSGLLTVGQREKWKVATLKCDKLIKKMSGLPFANEREYYDQTSEENKTGNKYSTIVDINILSKQLLGL